MDELDYNEIVSDDAGEGASPKRSVAGSLCGRLRFF